MHAAHTLHAVSFWRSSNAPSHELNLAGCRKQGQWPLAVHMLAFMGHSRLLNCPCAVQPEDSIVQSLVQFVHHFRLIVRGQTSNRAKTCLHFLPLGAGVSDATASNGAVISSRTCWPSTGYCLSWTTTTGCENTVYHEIRVQFPSEARAPS